MMPRHNTMNSENTVLLGGHGGMDSFAALIFPNKKQNIESSPKTSTPIIAKKIRKMIHKKWKN